MDAEDENAEQNTDPLAWPHPDEPLRKPTIADLDDERKRKALRFLGGTFITGVVLIVLLIVLFG